MPTKLHPLLDTIPSELLPSEAAALEAPIKKEVDGLLTQMAAMYPAPFVGHLARMINGIPINAEQIAELRRVANAHDVPLSVIDQIEAGMCAQRSYMRDPNALGYVIVEGNVRVQATRKGNG